MDELLTLPEAARYMRISTSTLYRWVHRKQIQHVKLGSRVLFEPDKLKEFVKNNTIP